MTTLNIREQQGEKIDKICFGSEGEYLELQSNTVLTIYDPELGDNIIIPFEDVPYLIKALEKACELWGAK